MDWTVGSELASRRDVPDFGLIWLGLFWLDALPNINQPLYSVCLVLLCGTCIGAIPAPTQELHTGDQYKALAS